MINRIPKKRYLTIYFASKTYDFDECSVDVDRVSQ